MRHFIFLTNEGETKTPQAHDIENLQVLGWHSGQTLEESFSKLLEESSDLHHKSFQDIVVMELKNEKQNFRSLADLMSNNKSR
jgi:hypothetical protein